jgi:hypothetical protein
VDEDETSLAAAAVYFAYGDALLCKVRSSFGPMMQMGG